MFKIIIAIDGFSSCGKSTTAKKVAAKLHYGYIDTGAMYRAVTLFFMQNNVSLINNSEIADALKSIKIDFKMNESGINETFLNNINVEPEIRSLRVSECVSEVSALPLVRAEMVNLQRKMGNKNGGFVMDGRDIGTVVFPDAELKVFMTALPNIRAERRQAELIANGHIANLDEILKNIEKRDLIDTTRADSPLKMADDAKLLDTSYITENEQVEQVCNWASLAIMQKNRKV